MRIRASVANGAALPAESPAAATTGVTKVALREPAFTCEAVSPARVDLRGHDHPAVAACGCGAHAALQTRTRSRPQRRASEAVTYNVTIAKPSSSYVDVTVRVPTGGKAHVDLAMPRWTPGSYKIRDYAKSVDDDVRASNDAGVKLPIDKTDVATWRVTTNGASHVSVRYRVYAHTELSVRTNWVEPSFALLNGAATFMTLADDTSRPHEVRIEAPSYGGTPASSLSPIKGNASHLRAASFDALVDSPIVLGANDRHDVVVDGVTYVLATHGADKVWDSAKAAVDLRRIIEAMHALWGKPPFERYVFLNLLSETRGGLEHLDSSVLMHSRWSTRSRDDYLNWLALASHELFHAWNVKRLRPKELGPFDYTRENVTASLWIAEGITAYYDKLLVRRSGTMSAGEYLQRLGTAISAAHGTPGSQVQTLCGSSKDAWLKYYQPDENSENVQVSYYDKGALVGFLLDAEIRTRTHGAKSLDDVMRAAYARYSGAEGYTPAQFEAVASEIAGIDLGAWFDRAVRSTEPLPVAETIASLGLRFKDPGAPASTAYLGARTKLDGHRMVVSRVLPATPAFDAGLMVGDEILAIDGYRVPPGELDARLARYKPGDAVSMLVARRDKLETLKLGLTSPSRTTWEVELDPDASAEAVTRRNAWLGS